MRRICLILLVLFSSLFLSLSHAQDDEEFDDEFFEDEQVIDPLDEPVNAPPTWDADGANPSPRPGGFPRPSGGGVNPGGGYSGSSGVFEFRLVDPPAYKKVKPPLRVPPRIRKQVEDNVRRSTNR